MDSVASGLLFGGSDGRALCARRLGGGRLVMPLGASTRHGGSRTPSETLWSRRQHVNGEQGQAFVIAGPAKAARTGGGAGYESWQRRASGLGRGCFWACETARRPSFANAGRGMGFVRGSAIRSSWRESTTCKSGTGIPCVRVGGNGTQSGETTRNNRLWTPATRCKPPLVTQAKTRSFTTSQRIAGVCRILEWAVQDLNLRHSACKADTLAN